MGMGIVLDNQPNFKRSIYNDGQYLVQSTQTLNEMATRLGVVPLMGFFSFSLAEAIKMLGEDFVEVLEAQGELREGRWFYQGNYFCSAQIEWFSASEGLKTVNELLKFIRSEPISWSAEMEDKEFTEDIDLALFDMQEVLSEAEQKQRRFHLCTT